MLYAVVVEEVLELFSIVDSSEVSEPLLQKDSNKIRTTVLNFS